MGNDQSAMQQLALSAAAVEANMIQHTAFLIDKDDDVLIVCTTPIQAYGISIILFDSSNIGWKECQAIADCMRVAAAGTALNQRTFQQYATVLRAKYNNVNGPMRTNDGTMVISVNPPRGNLQGLQLMNCLQNIKIASDGNVITVLARSASMNVFMAHIPSSQGTMTPQQCAMFVDVLSILEPGDNVSPPQFLAFASTLNKYGNIEVQRLSMGGFAVISIKLQSTVTSAAAQRRMILSL